MVLIFLSRFGSILVASGGDVFKSFVPEPLVEKIEVVAHVFCTGEFIEDRNVN